MFYCRADMGGFVVVLRILTDSFAISVSRVKKHLVTPIHTICAYFHHPDTNLLYTLLL